MWLLADAHYATTHNCGTLWSEISPLIGASGFNSTFITGVFVVVVPFLIGQFLDSLRNWGEDVADRKLTNQRNILKRLVKWLFIKKSKPDLDEESRIPWEKLKSLAKEPLVVFEDYYFSYYVFSANLWIGLTVGFLLITLSGRFPCDNAWLFVLPVAAGLVVFIHDARSLREEIREFLNDAGEKFKSNESDKD